MTVALRGSPVGSLPHNVITEPGLAPAPGVHPSPVSRRHVHSSSRLPVAGTGPVGGWAGVPQLDHSCGLGALEVGDRPLWLYSLQRTCVQRGVLVCCWGGAEWEVSALPGSLSLISRVEDGAPPPFLEDMAWRVAGLWVPGLLLFLCILGDQKTVVDAHELGLFCVPVPCWMVLGLLLPLIPTQSG